MDASHYPPVDRPSPVNDSPEELAAGAELPGFESLKLLMEPGGVLVSLDRAEIIVGRHSGADVRLPFPDISRHHCRFTFDGKSWHLMDMDSMNGVFLNGERVKDAVVAPGDTIAIGSFQFLVCSDTRDTNDPSSSAHLRTTVRTSQLKRNVAEALAAAGNSTQLPQRPAGPDHRPPT